jgi:hypothetical protein
LISDKTFGYVTFSSAQAIVIFGSFGASGAGFSLLINSSAGQIGSYRVVANVETNVGKLWPKNLNR